MDKLEVEAEEKRLAVRQEAERELTIVRDAAADLLRICSDPNEANRYFAVAERTEVEENEFNLNVPRYVDTFEPEELIPLANAFESFVASDAAFVKQRDSLMSLVKRYVP